MGARGKGGSGVGRWVHPDVWALLPSHIAVEACRLLLPKARIVLKYWQYPPKKGVLCIQQATDNRSEAIVARNFCKKQRPGVKRMLLSLLWLYRSSPAGGWESSIACHMGRLNNLA